MFLEGEKSYGSEEIYRYYKFLASIRATRSDSPLLRVSHLSFGLPSRGGRGRRGGGDRWAVKTGLDAPASKSEGDVYQPLSGHINQPWQRSLALFTMFGERR